MWALLWPAVALAPASASLDAACPASGGGSCGANPPISSGGAASEYLYPQGRGHWRHFSQSPYSFGGRECNLTTSLAWSWDSDEVVVGKPIVDDHINFYIATERAMRKFSPDGRVLWEWVVPDYGFSRMLTNHPAIMDGLVYDCIGEGQVVALSMETGRLVWEANFRERGINGDTAFVTTFDGMVILDVDATEPPNVSNRIVALNGTTGAVLWAFKPDTGVWNFLPHFPGDGTMVFQGWSGSAHRLNLSSGEELWRAGPPPGGIAWTDGGPVLGPNGYFYTVSSDQPQSQASFSKGGALRAFRVSDGALVWSRSDFGQGIYTYPAVGRLGGPSSKLTLVTGVGSLASFPGSAVFALAACAVAACGLALCLAAALLCFISPWHRDSCRRKAWKRCRRSTGLVLLLSASAGALPLTFMPSVYRAQVRAFDAETGEEKWGVDLPEYRGYAALGDTKHFWLRPVPYKSRGLCLPLASSYGVLDAQGAFYMGHLDGKLYRIKDWDGDGTIGAGEVCTFQAPAGFHTGGITLLPGRLMMSTCYSIHVFQE